MIIKVINKVLKVFNFEIVRVNVNSPIDIIGDGEFMKFYALCAPYTQTSIERLYSLYQTCHYIIQNNIPGDFVECGVWKGGSAMMMAYVLKSKGITDRKIHLFDTFEGMSEPTNLDVSIIGKSAAEQLKEENKLDDKSIWCYAPLVDVKENMKLTGYPFENFVFIKGKVEDTLAQNLPISLSVLRLDTDWYESTKIELELLYPILGKNGVLIIDDFGHWEGAKRAVLEYFGSQSFFPMLSRIDITGRMHIKN